MSHLEIAIHPCIGQVDGCPSRASQLDCMCRPYILERLPPVILDVMLRLNLLLEGRDGRVYPIWLVDKPVEPLILIHHIISSWRTS